MLVSAPIRNTLGYSLIELMVGIALIAVLAGLGATSYRDWIENTRIRSAAESIQNGLQVARAEAVKRNAQVQFVFTGNSAWTVGCVVAVGDADGDGADDCPATIKSRNQNEGSTANITVLTTPAAQSSVVFTNLGATTPASFTSVDIDSTAVSGSRALRITVGVGGNIRMCDPAVAQSSDDSRKC
jgi:type IV fimbrial biogenesis protein FimT